MTTVRAYIAAALLAVALPSAAVVANDGGSATSPTPAGTVEEITVYGRQDKIIDDFVKSYAAPTRIVGQLARWKVAVCPSTSGLAPALNAAVNRRLTDIAQLVGAGPKPKDKCRPNVRVVFTFKPQDYLDEMRATSTGLLGYHDAAQTKQLATTSRLTIPTPPAT